jgi:hypothetical protein
MVPMGYSKAWEKQIREKTEAGNIVSDFLET